MYHPPVTTSMTQVKRWYVLGSVPKHYRPGQLSVPAGASGSSSYYDYSYYYHYHDYDDDDL